MKKNIALLLGLVMLLTGCSLSGTENSSTSSLAEITPPSSAAEVEQPGSASANDTYYPIGENQGYRWLQGGTLLAVPHEGELQYINLENHLVRRVQIPADQLIGDYRFVLSDRHILVMGGYDYDTGLGNAGAFSACYAGGQWALANGSIWDEQGKPVREFLRMRENDHEEREDWGQLSDGRVVKAWEDMAYIETAHWVNEDLLVFNAHSRLFLYRISTDTLTLVDDMSSWMLPMGKMQVYYGVAKMMPAQDGLGVYYSAHKDQEKGNTESTLWYADETGTRALFDGQAAQNPSYQNGMLVLLQREEDPTDDAKTVTRVYYSKDEQPLQMLEELKGYYTVERNTEGFVVLTNSNIHEFYIIDTSDASTYRYQPQIENCNQYEMLGVRRKDSGFDYIYTTFIEGETGYHIYDTTTQTSSPMSSKPYLFRDEALHAPMTHFVERTPNSTYDDMFNTTGVRVAPLEQ